MSENGFIYAHVDPRNHQVYYVGMAKDAFYRLRIHWGGATNPDHRQWLEGMRTARLRPILRLIESYTTLAGGKVRESYWIRTYLQQGMPLTNRRL